VGYLARGCKNPHRKQCTDGITPLGLRTKDLTIQAPSQLSARLAAAVFTPESMASPGISGFKSALPQRNFLPKSKSSVPRAMPLTPRHRQTSLMTSHNGFCMKNWPVQDAKARFSEFLQASLTDGPQLVTLRGSEAAVLVGMAEWRRLNARARPGFKTLLLSNEARADFTLPKRGKLRRRKPQELL
jgi:antitoxin Phd